MATVADLVERMNRLEAENAELRGRIDALEGAASPAEEEALAAMVEALRDTTREMNAQAIATNERLDRTHEYVQGVIGRIDHLLETGF